MYAQWQALLARHTVTLITFAGPEDADLAALAELRASGAEVCSIWRAAPYGLGRWRRRVWLARGYLRGDRPMRALEFADSRMQALLDHTLGIGSFDLIQVEDNAMGAYRYPPRLPTVLTEHEVRDPAGGADAVPTGNAAVERLARHLCAPLSEAERRRWGRYQSAVWHRFDRIQVFTGRDANILARAAPAMADRIRVNPFGVALPPAADPREEDSDTVLFVGSFAHAPNIDAARWLGDEIMPRLRSLRPSARLLIVGAQPPQSVRTLADTGRQIEVAGYVPSLRPYLARAAVVVAPLREGGGMRLKVLEALAAGKAVVATSLATSGLERAEGIGRLPLVVADDADAFAAEIASLLGNCGARRRMGGRARAYVARHHTWSAYADRLEATYAGLVTRTGGR